MNAVVIAVIVMLVLSLSRVHVVLSLTVGAFVGGVVAGMPLQNITDAAGQVSQAGIIPVFNKGLEGGAKIALSYAMLGAFAMAITHSGLPQQLAGAIIRKLNRSSMPDSVRSGEGAVKWLLLSIILVMGIMSQNVVPIHIAFIPMIVPPAAFGVQPSEGRPPTGCVRHHFRSGYDLYVSALRLRCDFLK